MSTPKSQQRQIEQRPQENEQVGAQPSSGQTQFIDHTQQVNNGARFLHLHDKEIWSAFKEGDESAFIFIYTKYFKLLSGYGLQFSDEIDLIEDSIQDLFVELRKKRKRLGELRTSIKLYLFICLRRRILEYKKQSAKKMNASQEIFREFEIIPPVETHLINESILREQKMLLNKAMDNLTKKQREVIYYLYYQNMSYKEVKDLMGLKNVKSVRNILYKALAGIKVVMKMMPWILFWAVLNLPVIASVSPFS